MSILVTGGSGFIGSHLVSHLLHQTSCRVVNLDRMSYNSRPPPIAKEHADRYTHVHMDICDPHVLDVLKEYDVRNVYHLAAETHVDKSFQNSVTFSKSNVVGTHNLLECVAAYGKVQRFLHMSTDEVYGQVFEQCKETAEMNPTNPYAASKCGAEMLVRAYGHSYKLPWVIVRGNNVYGPQQFPDKLIPLFTRNLLQGQTCCIHGAGLAKRHFVHVADVCSALFLVAQKGRVGEVYNIASKDEFTVLQIYRQLVQIIQPESPKRTEVKDRPFNDMRYDISGEKLEALGWRRAVPWESGLRETVLWYKRHGSTYWNAESSLPGV